MRSVRYKGTAGALTLVEVLIVIGVVTILILVSIPGVVRDRTTTNTAPIAQCINNLRQIGSSLQTWADDHNGQLPWQVSTNACGTKELISSRAAYLHYEAISRELHNPRVLWCPADRLEEEPSPVAGFDNPNISYFVSVDATLSISNAIVAGDRNLQVEGKPVRPGIFPLTAVVPLGWTRGMHVRKIYAWKSEPCGNMLFTDGHVETVGGNLNEVVQRQVLATNRLVVP
jgi:competence protein ComGC